MAARVTKRDGAEAAPSEGHRRWRDPPDRRGHCPHDAARGSGRRRPEHAARRRARTVAAGGLPLPGEDLPLRSRADPRASRPRTRVRRPRVLRDLRTPHRPDPSGPPAAGGRADPGLRPVLDGRRQPRLVRPGAGRAGLRREALHARGQLGHRRQQHPCLLHPGPDQVPGHHPCGEGRARPRLPAGAIGA